MLENERKNYFAFPTGTTECQMLMCHDEPSCVKYCKSLCILYGFDNVSDWAKQPNLGFLIA